MALYNGKFWAWQIRRVFIPDIQAFGRCLTQRLLPTFATLDEEAHHIEQEAWDRPCYDENVDPGDLAESARDEAIAFVQTMESIRQGIINMVAAGLWHVVEQKLLILHRRELLDLHEQADADLWKLAEIKKRLKAAGLDIDSSFATWPRLDELRLLANTVKHADGPSCAELKTRRPELFIRPPRPDDPMPPLPDGFKAAQCQSPVFEPILGESVYITREQFDEYVDAVLRFFNDLADALEHMS